MADNANTNQFNESNSHFFYAASMWIPIVNFGTNITLFKNMAKNLRAVSKNEQIRIRTNRLSRAFMIMFIMVMIFLVLIFRITYWIEALLLMAFVSVGILVWIVQVLRFTRFIGEMQIEKRPTI